MTLNLMEVVFDALTPAQVVNLFSRIAGVDADQLIESLRSEYLVDIPVDTIAISETISLLDARLRLFPCDQHLVVELNFNLEDVRGDQSQSFQAAFHEFSMSAAKAAGIATYYGGFEPAMDIETRLFTGEELGPMIFC